MTKLSKFAFTFYAFAIALFVSLFTSAASAYDLLTETAGVVAFTPDNLTAPIIAGIVLAVAAGTVIFVIFKGVRMVLKGIGLIAR